MTNPLPLRPHIALLAGDEAYHLTGASWSSHDHDSTPDAPPLIEGRLQAPLPQGACFLALMQSLWQAPFYRATAADIAAFEMGPHPPSEAVIITRGRTPYDITLQVATPQQAHEVTALIWQACHLEVTDRLTLSATAFGVVRPASSDRPHPQQAPAAPYISTQAHITWQAAAEGTPTRLRPITARLSWLQQPVRVHWPLSGRRLPHYQPAPLQLRLALSVYQEMMPHLSAGTGTLRLRLQHPQLPFFALIAPAMRLQITDKIAGHNHDVTRLALTSTLAFDDVHPAQLLLAAPPTQTS